MHEQRVVNYTVAKLNHPLSQYIPPISRIPVELLSEIFLFSCALQARYGYEVHDFSPFDKRASPMNLTHINGHWRHVAISHPRLWTDIYIFHMFPRSPNSLKLWLERSRNLPLHIAFETRRYCWSSRSPDTCSCDVPCPLHEDPRTNEILSLMVDHSSRWEEVDFNICTYNTTPLLSLKLGDLGSLKTASFQDLFAGCNSVGPVELHCTHQHQEIFWKVAAASPMLEEVVIQDGLPSHLHWNRLKSISVESRMDITWLTECTQLQSLRFGQPCSPIDPSNRILLPNLTYLRISPPPDGPGLNSFTLPSLQTLYLEARTPSKSLLDLEQFMQRSDPPLMSLTIDSSCWWGETISSKHKIDDPSGLLLLLSSSLMAPLTSLTMKGCPSPPQLIHFLSLPQSSCLPSLEKLSIEYPATICMADIADMLAVRNHPQQKVVVPLRNLDMVIRNDHWVRDEPQKLPYHIPGMEDIQYEGCRIIIKPFDTTLTKYVDYYSEY